MRSLYLHTKSRWCTLVQTGCLREWENLGGSLGVFCSSYYVRERASCASRSYSYHDCHSLFTVYLSFYVVHSKKMLITWQHLSWHIGTHWISVDKSSKKTGHGNVFMYFCKNGDNYLYVILNNMVVHKIYAYNAVFFYDLLLKKSCNI